MAYYKSLSPAETILLSDALYPPAKQRVGTPDRNSPLESTGVSSQSHETL